MNYSHLFASVFAGLLYETSLAGEFFTTGPLTPESEAARKEITFHTETPPPPDPFPIESFGSDYGRVNVQELARREQQNPDAFKRGPFVAPNPPLSEVASPMLASGSSLPQRKDVGVFIPVGDFNGDGWPDLLWRHYKSGDNAVWFLKRGNFDSAAFILAVPDTNWEIKGAFIVDRDDGTDLLWHHRVTGENAIWYMNGPSLESVSILPSVTDTNWTVGATGFFRFGYPGIVWRHQKTGQNAVWNLARYRPTALVSVDFLPTVEDLNWQIAVAPVPFASSTANILWRNYSTGENALWVMSEATFAGVRYLPRVEDTNWVIGATADYNRDRHPDLVWRHNLTGENAIWLMKGETIDSVLYLPWEKDSNWRIVGPK